MPALWRTQRYKADAKLVMHPADDHTRARLGSLARAKAHRRAHRRAIERQHKTGKYRG